jgi:hypothetical protein
LHLIWSNYIQFYKHIQIRVNCRVVPCLNHDKCMSHLYICKVRRHCTF